MRLSLFYLTPQHHCHTAINLFTTPSSSTRPRMVPAATAFHRRKDKVVVIMGATGSGKSRLSVDLATLFFSFSEIINSDKMQVYNGLETTTNKIPPNERNGVPHHLLGDVPPAAGEFFPSDFRLRAGGIISNIISRSKLPIVVGGSNSFIHALLVERFHPELNVFNGDDSVKISSQLRYDCCFLWVDISFAVLSEYLLKRVDDMVDAGMVDELAEFFDPDSPDLELDSEKRSGLRKAIGVPEFDRFFKEYPPGRSHSEENDPLRKAAYDKAVRAIKDNTCQLAKRQIGKIMRLKAAGWDLRRIDATEAFRALMTSGRTGGAAAGERWSDLWQRDVLQPSVNIVGRFLME